MVVCNTFVAFLALRSCHDLDHRTRASHAVLTTLLRLSRDCKAAEGIGKEEEEDEDEDADAEADADDDDDDDDDDGDGDDVKVSKAI